MPYVEFISYDSVSQDSQHHFFIKQLFFFAARSIFRPWPSLSNMTPPLYETPAPPSSSIQVTFAFFVGTSENRIARLPRYPDSPNMALALHAARRPTLLFEFLDYPHQSLNFLFLESFVVQPQLRIGGSIGIQRDQSKAYLPLSTSKCHTRFAPLNSGRDSSGAL